MKSEWFAHMLAQPDVRSHSAAAIFLASQGRDGYCHVGATLDRCKQLDLTKADFDKCEDILLLSGTRAIATIIHDVGYDETVAIHRYVLHWADGLSRFRTAKIRMVGIWGLGDLGVPPDIVRTRLHELATEEKLSDDSDVITCRGMAFRMLARVDRCAASKLIETSACGEYLDATELWRAESLENYPENTKRVAALDAEAGWLQAGR